jgi:DNA-binding NtrC family response regulator
VEKYRFRTNPGFLTDQALSGMGLVGQSRPMQQVFRQILDVAKTSAPVLLTGETGTGKTLTAMAIHKSSKRHNKKFVFLDCTKKSTDLVLSELFGHDKGVFTDAKEIRKGLFEDAEGGTVLLDEIGDLDEDKQIGLLKVIDSGQYKRAGEHEIRQIDCRLIYATNRDLKDLVESGNMRNDFYYRLDHSVRVHLPPLREHKEDIPLLADHFLQVATIKHELTPRILTDDAMQMLRDFDWPGNIRQVANVIERAAITTSTGFIHGEDIALHCEDKSSHRDFILLDGSVSLPEVLKKHERDYICQALAITKGNISAAADLLKIDRTNLQKKKETHGIDVSVFKGGDCHTGRSLLMTIVTPQYLRIIFVP